MNRHARFARAPKRAQGGAALIVVLMLLLIVTLLGLASMRGAILQERMAGALIGRSMAFQAAEAALKEGEAYAAKWKPVKTGTGCANGVCARLAPGTTPPWKDASSNFWDTTGNYQPAPSVNDVESRYMIEDYGFATSDECAASVGTNPLDMGGASCTAEIRIYRIAARSRTKSGSEVVLQSLYRAP